MLKAHFDSHIFFHIFDKCIFSSFYKLLILRYSDNQCWSDDLLHSIWRSGVGIAVIEGFRWPVRADRRRRCWWQRPLTLLAGRGLLRWGGHRPRGRLASGLVPILILELELLNGQLDQFADAVLDRTGHLGALVLVHDRLTVEDYLVGPVDQVSEALVYLAMPRTQCRAVGKT